MLLHSCDADAQYNSMLAQANEDMTFAGFQLKILKNPVREAAAMSRKQPAA